MDGWMDGIDASETEPLL